LPVPASPWISTGPRRLLDRPDGLVPVQEAWESSRQQQHRRGTGGEAGTLVPRRQVEHAAVDRADLQLQVVIADDHLPGHAALDGRRDLGWERRDGFSHDVWSSWSSALQVSRDARPRG
jgi:hypothetical protein